MSPNKLDSASTMADLATRLQNLPAELYSNILDLVFTPDTSEVTIAIDYQPPARLQVSRSTRSFFASSYYSNTTFHFDVVDKTAANKRASIWLKSLPEPHGHSINTVHLFRPSVVDVVTPDLIMECYRIRLREIFAEVFDSVVENLRADTVVQTSVHLMTPKKAEEIVGRMRRKKDCMRFETRIVSCTLEEDWRISLDGLEGTKVRRSAQAEQEKMGKWCWH